MVRGAMIRHVKTIAMLGGMLMIAACTSPNPEKSSGAPIGPHFWDEIPVCSSTTPPDRIKDGYWSGQFKRVNKAVAEAEKPGIVFFGDSITWHWNLGRQEGQKVWNEYYVKRNAVNMGNSGDITPVMLYRVTHGNLDFPRGQDPKVAVLLCGTNNYVVTGSAGGKVKWDLGADCPPEDVAHGVRAVAQVFRRRLPRTRVVMMGILPVANREKWAKCRKTNDLNAALTYNNDEVIYLDLADKFLQPDGSINSELFSDGTHPNPAGYKVWAESLEPIVSKIIEGDYLNPTKIMLIGDSITEGACSSCSYRRYLDGMLRRDGHLIDFIGSRAKHGGNKVEPDNYEYDVDHEGHWGKDSDWLAKNISSLLTDNASDVAVIHMGTEDIVSGAGTEAIIKNTAGVIKALRSKNRNVKIVLSKLIPVKGKASEVAALNAEIARLAKAQSTAKSPIVLVDNPTGFDASSDLAEDGVLPNAAGAKKMAGTFARALDKILTNLQTQKRKR